MASPQDFSVFYFASPLFVMEFFQSPKKFTHERTVYSLLRTIGNIGGFTNVIKIVFTFIMSFYSPALL